MLVVIDTNVFVTALLRGAISRQVYAAFLDGQLTPVFSSDTLRELTDVLLRPPLRVLMNDAEVETALRLIERDALIVQPARDVHACRDPKDNALLECALEARATCLVTGDRDLLVLNPFRGIRILRPAEFLHLLS